MKFRWLPALMLFVSPVLFAQDLRGIYVFSNDVSQLSKTTATNVTAALSVPGVDGLVLDIAWSAIEPSMGQYDFTLLDQWIDRAAGLGKKVDLAITAGGSEPAWLFQQAGAPPLNFTISPHGGQTSQCQTETLTTPWNAAFLAQWDSMLANVAAHLKSTGRYGSITMLRLTGINRTTEEFRLPAETAQSTGLACVTNALTTWQQAGYKPSLLLQGWDGITTSFKKSFPDKFFSIAIIPSNAFPAIAEDGTLIKGTPSDANQPLLALAAQKFPGHLIIQMDFLMTGEAPSSAVIQYGQTFNTMIAWQTNEYFGSTGQGAACSEPVSNPTPCTSTTFLQMLETGIYPLGQSNALRGQYIEVFQSNANAFPDAVFTAHYELEPLLRHHATRH